MSTMGPKSAFSACFRDFFMAYLECAEWTNLEEPPHGAKPITGGRSFSAEATKKAHDDCEKFIADNCKLLVGLESEQCGHDFWLTRNRHGAGFWDRGYGQLGKDLTRAAQKFPEQHTWINDNNEFELE